MSVFRNAKKPAGRKMGVTGGWPKLNPVPGDGDVIKPAGGLSPASSAHAADEVEGAFGVGKAKQRSGNLNRGRPGGGNV